MALYSGVHSVLRKQTHCWHLASQRRAEEHKEVEVAQMNCLKIIIKKQTNKQTKKKKQSGLQGLKDYMSVLRYFHSWVLIKCSYNY